MNYKKFVSNNDIWLTYDAYKDDNDKIIFYATQDGTPLFSIDKKRYYLGNFSKLNLDEQDKIIEFLHQEPKEWFEQIYNLILAKVDGGKAAYAKKRNGEFTIIGLVSDDIDEDKKIKGSKTHCDIDFNDYEIEELKSKLPDNLKKIVDLAKVSVNK